MDSAALCEQDPQTMLLDLLEAWKLKMRASARSPRTIDERCDLVLRLARRFPDVDTLFCGWETLAEFINTDGFQPSTRRQYQTMLHQWYAWLVTRGVRQDNPVDELDAVRVGRRVPRPTTTDQLGLALTSRRFYSKTYTQILLGAYHGLRVGEIANVRGEDFRNGRHRIIGKGSNERVIPIHPLVAAELPKYPRIGPWFPSPADRTQPVTAKNVSRVLSEALHRCGVPCTAHQLRHWYGTSTLKSSGNNLRVVQELLGHASLAHVALYTLVDDEQMKLAVEGLPVPLHLAPRCS